MPLDDINWRDIVNNQDDVLYSTPLEIIEWLAQNSLALDSLTVAAIDKAGNSKIFFKTVNLQHSLQTIALLELTKLQILKQEDGA